MIEYDWWFIRMDWSWVVPPAWHRPCSLVALPCPSWRNWSSTWCLQSVLLCRPWKFCCYQRHLDLEGHFTMGCLQIRTSFHHIPSYSIISPVPNAWFRLVSLGIPVISWLSLECHSNIQVVSIWTVDSSTCFHPNSPGIGGGWDGSTASSPWWWDHLEWPEYFGSTGLVGVSLCSKT